MNTYPTCFDEGTVEEVKAILESLCHSEKWLRLYYGDKESGLCWGDEFNTMGYIGRSTGTKPVMLLVNNKRSLGGPGILTACIIKITYHGRVLYQHPTFHNKNYEIQSSTTEVYLSAVYADNVIVAQFKRPGQAEKWIDFMTGARDSKS
jgi:hypothetical protein